MSNKHDDLNDYPSGVWPPPIVGQIAPDVTTRHKAFVWLPGFLGLLCTILGEATACVVHGQVAFEHPWTLHHPIWYVIFYLRELGTEPYRSLLSLGYVFLGMGMIGGILRHHSRLEKFGFGLAMIACVTELIWRIVVMSVYIHYVK